MHGVAGEKTDKVHDVLPLRRKLAEEDDDHIAGIHGSAPFLDRAEKGFQDPDELFSLLYVFPSGEGKADRIAADDVVVSGCRKNIALPRLVSGAGRLGG